MYMNTVNLDKAKTKILNKSTNSDSPLGSCFNFN